MYKLDQNAGLIKAQFLCYYIVQPISKYMYTVPVLERLLVLKNTFHSLPWFQTSSKKPALKTLPEVPPNLSEETSSYLEITGILLNSKFHEILHNYNYTKLEVHVYLNLPSHIFVKLHCFTFIYSFRFGFTKSTKYTYRYIAVPMAHIPNPRQF